RYPDVREIAQIVSSMQVHNPRRLFEWETAEKQFVYQTKERGVQPDAESEGHNSDKRKSGRFTKLAQSEADVVHIIRCVMLELGRRVWRGARGADTPLVRSPRAELLRRRAALGRTPK